MNRRAEYIGNFVKDIFLLSYIQLWPNCVEGEPDGFCLSTAMSSKERGDSGKTLRLR